MKHTKGPWHFVKQHNKRTIYRVGQTSPRIGFAHNDYDARLMAAAPELLEALDKAYLQIIVFLNEGDFKRDVTFDAGYIVEALAKARGEIL